MTNQSNPHSREQLRNKIDKYLAHLKQTEVKDEN
jgi:hypothetical protein